MNAFETMNHEYITFDALDIFSYFRRNLIHSSFPVHTYVALFYAARSYLLIATTKIQFTFLFHFRLMMLHFMQPDPTFLLQLHLDFWSIGYHDQEAIELVNERLSRFL